MSGGRIVFTFAQIDRVVTREADRRRWYGVTGDVSPLEYSLEQIVSLGLSREALIGLMEDSAPIRDTRCVRYNAAGEPIGISYSEIAGAIAQVAADFAPVLLRQERRLAALQIALSVGNEEVRQDVPKPQYGDLKVSDHEALPHQRQTLDGLGCCHTLKAHDPHVHGKLRRPLLHLVSERLEKLLHFLHILNSHSRPSP